MAANERWAFWEYDRFPFVLSGRMVGRADKEGRVRVEGYEGMLFTPLRIIPGYGGRAMHERLDVLKGSYLMALQGVEDEYRKKALKTAAWLRSCKRTSFYRQ